MDQGPTFLNATLRHISVSLNEALEASWMTVGWLTQFRIGPCGLLSCLLSCSNFCTRYKVWILSEQLLQTRSLLCCRQEYTFKILFTERINLLVQHMAFVQKSYDKKSNLSGLWDDLLLSYFTCETSNITCKPTIFWLWFSLVFADVLHLVWSNIYSCFNSGLLV